MLWAAAYLAAVNLIAFCAMGLDKNYARKRKRRIPERILFLYAFLGGATSSAAGMYLFRHKTLHKKFALGLPALAAGQIALVFILLKGVYS